MTEKILFYKKDKPYGFLSNFYPSPFEIDGKHCPTSEHFYQSQKIKGTPWEKAILEALSPK